tara:strand:- start:2753 stop:3661 length:909 start_codon:yes stop_codon:yes gene_type:complete
MPIDRGFILAAGKGSRMGPIGKDLPKVLWPLFETTLLGMQIDLLHRLGVKDIWVNAHHHSQDLKSYLDHTYTEINFLHEPELLDAGGGVHNFILKSKTHSPFVVINSDQYLEVDKQSLNELLAADPQTPSTLCAMNVEGDYSSLICRDGYLASISKSSNGPMFTGLSRINPTTIQPSIVPSKFFETVCAYQKERVKVVVARGVFLDFGSPSLYRESLTKLFDKLMTQDSLLDQWVESGMVDKNKINKDLKSYNCDQPGVLNFSGKDLKYKWPKNSIIIQEPSEFCDPGSAAIIYNEKFETLS